MLIRILGVDPSLNNTGLTNMTYDTETGHLRVQKLNLIKTESQSCKAVRKNSDDLRRARTIMHALHAAASSCHCVMAEVPTGTQSARGSISNGICIGVLAGCPKPLVEVTPSEVKMASVGKKTASKQEMIDWAVSKHGTASWLTRAGKRTQNNEHLADAIATVYAGIRTEQFKGMVSMLEEVSRMGHAA